MQYGSADPGHRMYSQRSEGLGIASLPPNGRGAASVSDIPPTMRDFAMKMMPVGCLLLAISGYAAHAQAVEVEALDTWSVGVGSFALNLDADLRVDGSAVDGRELSLSRDLGLDLDTGIGFFSVGWRPFENHQFDLSYYGDDVSATNVIEREIIIDDETFNVGATVDSRVGYDAYDLSYTWWLHSVPKQAFGINIGLVYYSLDLDVRAEVTEGEQAIEHRASTSADLPAPKIGISYRRAFGQGWRFYADASAFTAKIGRVDADVLDTNTGLEYFPWEHVGARLQYSVSRIRAEAEKNDFNGKADLNFSGLQLQLVGRF